MKLTIDKHIFEKFPGLTLGVVVIHGADNTKKLSEVADMLRAEEVNLRQRPDIEPVKEHPAIDVWRQAHRAFGNNPNRYAPSVEAVIKRVVKGGQLPAINTLVDLYNYSCLKYIVPVGGEDLDTCVGDIELTRATGNEEFTALGEEQNDPPAEGEVIYKDQVGVLRRRFNWREANRTKLTEKTKNAMIVIEGLFPKTAADITSATTELEAAIKKYCGAETKTFLMSATTLHEIEL